MPRARNNSSNELVLGRGLVGSAWLLKNNYRRSRKRRRPSPLRIQFTMPCVENDSCVYQRPIFPTAALCAHENILWAAKSPFCAPSHFSTQIGASAVRARPRNCARHDASARCIRAPPRGRVSAVALDSGQRELTRPRRDCRVVRPARPRAPTTRHRVAGPLCYEAWGPESMRVLKVCARVLTPSTRRHRR